jgi:hypothetical protein
MTPMSQLWLPILLSFVAVFVVSSIIHMASPWHKSDYPRLANEDAVMDALRPLAIPPGDYMFPRPASMAEMKSPEFTEKLKRGPKVVMTVMPNGNPGMTGNFVGWVIFILIVTLFAAHLAATLLAPAADGMRVFHTVALITFASYAFALWPLSIWYNRAWNITIKGSVDGLIYGVVTGLVFMWLWPR